MGFEKEIREQKAQGATEIEILATLIKAYDSDEIDFEEFMEKVSALNNEFGAQYDVSALEDNEEEQSIEEDGFGEDEEAKADQLFGMQNENEEQSTMEDEQQ